MLQARLELASGNHQRALTEARELIDESTQSGDAVRAIAARLLEVEALAASGKTIDAKAVGDTLKRAADVLGGESWRLTARLAQLTQNAGWTLLAERQLEHLVTSSGERAPRVRSFAAAYRERIAAGTLDPGGLPGG